MMNKHTVHAVCLKSNNQTVGSFPEKWSRKRWLMRWLIQANLFDFCMNSPGWSAKNKQVKIENLSLDLSEMPCYSYLQVQ
jgi:hypothetical protein